MCVSEKKKKSKMNDENKREGEKIHQRLTCIYRPGLSHFFFKNRKKLKNCLIKIIIGKVVMLLSSYIS